MVTGATGGIGSAVVAALVGRGHGVVALGRDAGRLARLARDGVTPVAHDLRRGRAAPPEVLELERLDALVHCAGVAPVASVAGTTAETWDEVLGTNLVGPARLTAAALPALRAAQGAVVLVGMAPGLQDVPRWSAYAGSKAALRELAGSLRAEEPLLRVALVNPGGTATPLLARVRHELGRPYDPATALSPAAVAETVADLLDSPAAGWRDVVDVLG